MREVVATPFSENGPAVTPTGQYFAFASSESGRTETIYRGSIAREIGGR
jgi:Tol biopolymer transport system component